MDGDACLISCAVPSSSSSATARSSWIRRGNGGGASFGSGAAQTWAHRCNGSPRSGLPVRAAGGTTLAHRCSAQSHYSLPDSSLPRGAARPATQKESSCGPSPSRLGALVWRRRLIRGLRAITHRETPPDDLPEMVKMGLKQ